MVSTTLQGGWGVPGAGDAIETNERAIFWGGDWGKGHILTMSAVYSSTLADAGNTPTTDIRPGLLVGKITATGELAAWDADATNGTQNLWGVNFLDLRMIDFNATAADRVAPVAVRAPFKASQLLIQGAAFVGHADEYTARSILHGGGSVLDDDPQGYLAGGGGGGSLRMAHVTGTTDVLTAAETGTTLFYNNAASVTVTLPAIAAGLSFTIIRVADEELIIASAEGDNIISIGDLSADSVTFTTASEHLGAGVHVRSVLVNTTLKWLITVLPVPLVGVDSNLSALTFTVAT